MTGSSPLPTGRQTLTMKIMSPPLPGRERVRVRAGHWISPSPQSSPPVGGEEVFEVKKTTSFLFQFRSLGFGHYLIIGAWNLEFRTRLH